jgi:crossover junction endodeoxyribonuclease RuvC
VTADALFETPAAADRALGAAAGADAGPAGGEVLASMPAGPAHVVGLDLSLTSTGIACAHGARTIESAGKKGATLAQRQQRLRHLRTQIIAGVALCAGQQRDPDLIVIEGPSYSSKNAGSAHERSGLWWLLIDVFTIRGWRVIEAAPSTRMKYATGKGMVAKELVFAAAIKRLPIDVNNGDEADAAWLCAIGHALLGAPLVQLPAAHRDALTPLRAHMGDLA